MALNTVGTEKSSSLTPGAVTRGLEGNDDIDCRANDGGLSRWTPRLFLLKKKKVLSHHREKERKKEKKRENE